jgi:hypothetical protein
MPAPNGAARSISSLEVSSAMRSLAAFCCVLLFSAAPLTAQAEALHGSWKGVGEDNADEVLEFRADGTAVSDGERVRWALVRQGLLRITGEDGPFEVAYRLAGDRLVLTLFGDEYPYQRVGRPAPPPVETPRPAPPVDNPLAQPPAGNPLARPGPDAYARRFAGNDIALELSGSAAAGYRGTLEFAGATYPVTARLDQAGLRGTFEVGGQPFAFEARLDGDRLRLRSGGNEYQLEAPPLAADPAPAVQDIAAPAEGGGTRWQHPRGWFGFEMPRGWSVARELEDGLMLNPGLAPTDTLDALILVRHGRLDEAERRLAPVELIRRGEPDLRQELAGQGIRIGPAEKAPRAVQVGAAPAAEQTWRGTTQNGITVEVWLGALVEGEFSVAVVAVLVDGKGARFMPQIRRVFETLSANPPKDDPTALAGRSFSHSETFPGSGSFHTIYEFRADGTVRKQMIVSGGDVGGDSDEVGRFEVVGDEVTLSFGDDRSSGKIVVEGGVVRGLRFGRTLYRGR